MDWEGKDVWDEWLMKIYHPTQLMTKDQLRRWEKAIEKNQRKRERRRNENHPKSEGPDR